VVVLEQEEKARGQGNEKAESSRVVLKKRQKEETKKEFNTEATEVTESTEKPF
jgi:hypothetical protein